MLEGDDDKVVDVPIKFPAGKQTTADDLRESVLTMIESVEEQVVVAPPTVPQEEASVPEPTTVVAPDEQKVEAEAEKEDKPIVAEVASGLTLSEEQIKERRKQPKSPEEEARLAAKYAAIEDLGERAYTILKDLAMI